MTDEAIIALFRERSERAIEETDAKYGRLCKKLAMNILGNAQDAEECVNDAYLALWNNLSEESPEHFCAYLSRIVKNISFSRVDLNNAKKRSPAGIVPLDELDEVLGGGTDPEREVEAAELSESVNRFVRQLSERDRKVFLRRYWYYESVQSIAEDMKMRPDKVSGILHRLRKHLKEHLIREGFADE